MLLSGTRGHGAPRPHHGRCLKFPAAPAPAGSSSLGAGADWMNSGLRDAEFGGPGWGCLDRRWETRAVAAKWTPKPWMGVVILLGRGVARRFSHRSPWAPALLPFLGGSCAPQLECGRGSHPNLTGHTACMGHWLMKEGEGQHGRMLCVIQRTGSLCLREKHGL